MVGRATESTNSRSACFSRCPALRRIRRSAQFQQKDGRPAPSKSTKPWGAGGTRASLDPSPIHKQQLCCPARQCSRLFVLYKTTGVIPLPMEQRNKESIIRSSVLGELSSVVTMGSQYSSRKDTWPTNPPPTTLVVLYLAGGRHGPVPPNDSRYRLDGPAQLAYRVLVTRTDKLHQMTQKGTTPGIQCRMGCTGAFD
jgi:hypothetical protein